MSYTLRDFGSYFVGGRMERVSDRAVEEIAFTAQTRYQYDPNGHYAVEAAYVQYFIPERRRDLPPVILLHGGGMNGNVWERTPDGRHGWLHALLDQGLEVHVIDNVERGRAGWMPDLWPGKPVLRTLEEAWRLFRLGPPDGFASRRAFPGQRFPVEHLEDFACHFVPRWTSTGPAQSSALQMLLERLEFASVVCHSQGGAIAATAMARAPHRVAKLVAIEPSGFELPADTSQIPRVHFFGGDFLDCDELWRGLSRDWQALVAAHSKLSYTDLSEVFPGTSHMPMMDRGSETIVETIIDVLVHPD